MEKMLITIILSISHNVFHPFWVKFCHLNKVLLLVCLTNPISKKKRNFQKEIHISSHINPYTNKPWFLRVCSTSLSKTLWEKEKLLVTSNFSFSHSVFYPLRKLAATFINPFPHNDTF